MGSCGARDHAERGVDGLSLPSSHRPSARPRSAPRASPGPGETVPIILDLTGDEQDGRTARRQLHAARRIWCLAPTSMPRVGSSATRTRGSPSNARANISFCWLPPDSVPAGASRALGPLTLAREPWTRSASCRRRTNPSRLNRCRLDRLTFSRIGRPRHRPSSLRDSGMRATPASMPARGVPPVGRPSTSTRPELIRLALASARPSSERPAPTRPATPTISPACTCNDAPRTPSAQTSSACSATDASDDAERRAG